MDTMTDESDQVSQVSVSVQSDKQLIERLLADKDISTKRINDLMIELKIVSAKLDLHCNVITSETKCVSTQTGFDDTVDESATKETSVCLKCRQLSGCEPNTVVINDWKQNSETNKTKISDLVRQTAQQVVTTNDFQNDYIYDQKSKTYYSQSTGWYYYPDSSLFYDPNTKNYYKYDFETKEYNFYSSLKQMDKKRQKVSKTSDTSSKKLKSIKDKEVKSDCIEIISSSSEEEGEISDSNDENSVISDDSYESDEIIEEEKCKSSPPLVRMIVKESATLEIGSLLLVTCMGATIGNESNCDVWITDESVSRNHAEIKYDYNDNNYIIKDMNSTNGTFINANKIESNCETVVKHGDEISFGKCVLLVHIHYGKDVTCDRCEPGLVIASLKSNSDQNNSNLYELTDKEKDRKKQLKSLKKKYGLKDSDFCEEKTPINTNTNYTDRALKRRVVKGSDNPYEKTAAGTSLDSALSKSNKGFQMLEKMGWSTGQALGKHQNGIIEPVNVINGDSKCELQKPN